MDVLKDSIAHEVCHIMEGHFTQDMHAGLIEALLHGNESDFNHEEVNFYYQFIDWVLSKMEIAKALDFVDLNKMGTNQPLKLYKKIPPQRQLER